MEVTINYGGQIMSVEVSIEVYEFLDRADHKEENLAHEKRRHWDGREFDEYIAFTEGVGVFSETPEDYLCRKETLDELLSVLDRCTEAQRRRFLLYALDGMSYARSPLCTDAPRCLFLRALKRSERKSKNIGRVTLTNKRFQATQ